jgi:2-hydroxy-3-oxopropionate reductase
MAKNLLRAGYPLTVWNRTASKAEALAEHGAQITTTAAEAVAEAKFVITMVSDGNAVKQLLFEDQVAEAMAPGAIHVDMSSIRKSEAEEIAIALETKDLNGLDAPVSGGTKGAVDASLAIMVGGRPAIFEQSKDMLATMGRPVRVGPSGAGQLAKLINQGIVATTIGAVAEAMLLAEKGGADSTAIRAALKGGFADSIILQQHGQRMTERNFQPGGPSRLQLKDILNEHEVARAAGLELPLLNQMIDRYTRLCEELDGGEVDHSGIWLELADINGVEN